ncbi:MAG: hypothetical protein AAF982_08380 [Pseudomonadota bacterium]
MIAAMLVGLAQYWLYVGGAVALVFLSFGIDRIDEDARDAYVFRPLLIPGILLIWPLVLWRWMVLESGRDDWRLRHRPERRAHVPLGYALAVILPLIVIFALTLRQDWPDDVPPVRLEVPA